MGIRVTSLEASSSDTPLQGGSSSSKSVQEGELQQVASQASRLHLKKNITWQHQVKA